MSNCHPIETAVGITYDCAQLMQELNEQCVYERYFWDKINRGRAYDAPANLGLASLIHSIQLTNWRLGRQLARNEHYGRIKPEQITWLSYLTSYCTIEIPQEPVHTQSYFSGKFQNSHWVMAPLGVAMIMCPVPDQPELVFVAPLENNHRPNFDQFDILPVKDLRFASLRQIKTGIECFNQLHWRHGRISDHSYPITQLGDGYGTVFSPLTVASD